MVGRSVWSRDWQPGWSHDADNASGQVVPSSWHATHLDPDEKAAVKQLIEAMIIKHEAKRWAS